MDKTTVSFKKSATNYGLILGGVLSGLTAILYAVNLEMLANFWLIPVYFLLTLAFGIVSTAKSKSILGGFISFKEAFTSYFITLAIGLLISTLVSIIIFSIVDPGAAEYLKDQALEATRGMMERWGTPQEVIDEAMAQAEAEDSYGLFKQLQNYVISLAIYSIFGLLIALIMKRKDPNAA